MPVMAPKKQQTATTRRKALRTIGIGASTLTLPPAVGLAAGKEPEIAVPSGEVVPRSNVKTVPKAGDDLLGPKARGEISSDRKAGKSRVVANEKGPDNPGLSPSQQSDSLTPPDLTGWIASTSSALGSGREFDMLEAYWVCPSEPDASDPDLRNFFFPAFQNDGSFTTILQPVVGWNWGENDQWSLSSWWGPVTGTQYENSGLIDVDPGDEIYGYVQNLGSDWYINTRNVTTGQYTDIYTDNLYRGNFQYVYTAYETAYFDGTCSKKPGSCHFYDMYFEDSNDNSVSVGWSTWENSSFNCYVNPYAPSSSDTYMYL